MLIGLLVTLLVIVLILWLVGQLPLDAKSMMIARAVVIIVGILSLLRFLPATGYCL